MNNCLFATVVLVPGNFNAVMQIAVDPIGYDEFLKVFYSIEIQPK